MGFGRMLFGDPAPAAAVDLGELMRASWTAFATTGDPGWPKYAPADRLTQTFAAPPAVTPYPEETSRRLWAKHQFGVLQLAEGGQ